MAKVINRGNSKIVLRTPAEKAQRYARQLRNGVVTETGKKLTDYDKGFRLGYLTARSDSARVWKSKNKK